MYRLVVSQTYSLFGVSFFLVVFHNVHRLMACFEEERVVNISLIAIFKLKCDQVRIFGFGAKVFVFSNLNYSMKIKSTNTKDR